ncbi:acyltransferase family protein [Corynebacterium sp.]|uniref:acyltransferase family protein n=1 Tax=Corynebacterium sp. TaxID=1720 RepID=UPI0028B0B8BD|nr:acyltransferase family protein [Corynebacterium sp.]
MDSTQTQRRNQYRGHRRDIDGLRGLAIALVVVFHVFVGRVSAGVDVFLLLGGIFFFSPQIRNALNPAGLTVVQSFLRIFRRLYPALVTVVGVSLTTAIVVYSQVRWAATGKDAGASLLYLQNLNLSAQGNDYASISADVSVFQHIWSMSVQMQIYLGSLIVIALVAVVLRRHVRSSSQVLHWLLVGATLASFGYATWLGGHDQGVNYYSPLSRFWEIGLGGLFGIWLLGRVLPAAWAQLRLVAGVAGLALIIGTGLFLDGAAQFPGPWTLVPLAGAMLVVLAGNPVEDGDAGSAASFVSSASSSSWVTALLCTAPFQFLGRIAYSLYLWHWPILTLATYSVADLRNLDAAIPSGTVGSSVIESGDEATGGLHGITETIGTTTGILVGATVILLSLVLAWFTHRIIEFPLQQTARPPRSWVVWDRNYVWTATTDRGKASVAAVMAVLTAAVLAFGPSVERYNEARAAELRATGGMSAEYPGPAAFLDNAPVPEGVPVYPDAAEIGPLMPPNQQDECFTDFTGTEIVLTHDFNKSDEPCAYGDVESERTMYLAGGSHSEHYLPALDNIAKDRGIRIIPIVKVGCVLGVALPRITGEAYPECAEWEGKATDYIVDNPPTDGVFMTVTRPTNVLGDGPDEVPGGYVDVVSRFTDAGIHTWGVRDNPWLMAGPGRQLDARVCVAEGREDECGVTRDEALSAVNPAWSAFADLDITHIDLSEALCRDGWCPGVIGNVLVYRDSQHYTNGFAEMLGPEITRQMYDPVAVDEMAARADAAQ